MDAIDYFLNILYFHDVYDYVRELVKQSVLIQHGGLYQHFTPFSIVTLSPQPEHLNENKAWGLHYPQNGRYPQAGRTSVQACRARSCKAVQK